MEFLQKPGEPPKKNLPKFKVLQKKTPEKKQEMAVCRVEGWRVFIDLKIGVNKDLEYRFENKTTGDFMSVKNMSGDAKRSTYYSLSIPDDYQRKAQEGALLPLDLDRKNTITGYVKYRGRVVFELNTTVDLPKKYVTRNGSAILETESPHDRKLAMGALEIIDKMNRLTSPSAPLRIMLCDFGVSGLEKHLEPGGENILKYQYGARVIFGTQAQMASKRFQMMVFHECAHGYDDVKKASSGAFGDVYRSMMDVSELPLGIGKMAENDAALANRLINHPLILVFREGSYIYNSDPTYSNLKAGHPFDDEKELFASSSTVLKYFPDKFFENAGILERHYPKFAREARQIATETVKLWGNDRIFDPSVYARLGLPEPE